MLYQRKTASTLPANYAEFSIARCLTSFKTVTMPLVITITGFQGQAYFPETRIEFGGDGGSIGRNESNTLVLASKAVSGFHARIACKNGRFVLMDGEYELIGHQWLLKKPSTNGTVVYAGDGSPQVLKGAEWVLAGDEKITIGEFELKAETPMPNQALLDFGRQDSGAAGFDGPFGRQEPANQAEIAVPAAPGFGLSGKAGFDFLDQPAAIAPAADALGQPAPVFPALAGEPPAPSGNAGGNNPADILRKLVELYATGGNQTGQPQTPVQQPQQSEPAGVAAAPEARPAAQPGSDLLEAFLQGAGIAEHWPLPPEDQLAAMKTAGALFRSMVAGLMDELQARKAMKEEFRLAHTVLKPKANNPLKFQPDVASFIKLLLASDDPAFIRANDAVVEGFKDLKFHRLAMTAAFQASLESHLANFDPQVIERSAGDGNPLTKKSRCWAVYCERFPELKDRAVQEIFGEAFAEEYEKHMRQFTSE